MTFAEDHVEERRGKVEFVYEDMPSGGLPEGWTEEEYEEYTSRVVEDPDEEYEFSDELTTTAMQALGETRNILLLGIDARSGSAGRSDTMILLTINARAHTIKLTSFLRDTYVEIPGKKNNRLNAAYVFGGADLLCQTMKQNFGIEVDDYVAVNLEGLASLIDQLGGLWIDVDAKKVDRINAVIKYYNLEVLGINQYDGYLKAAGYQLLNGKQAESWARFRYGSGESDLTRSTRQRELIRMIFEKVTQMSAAQLLGFAANNMRYVKTNLTLSEITSLIPAVYQMADASIEELRIPMDGAYRFDTISGMAVIVPDRQKNLNALAEFLKN